MVALVKTLQVILALSLLIIVHELGHFMWARIFGIRVEKFYLFFDAGGKALARWHWGETEFGIGWIPFGGYCKIAGMVDESMDLEQLKREPQSWEFRTKPAWQRLLVMAGGVLNNFIFAILMYCLIAGIWGEVFISNKDAQIAPNELASEMGFRLGDHIISFDGYEPENFGMLQADLARRDVRNAKLLRGSDTLDLYIDQSYISKVLTSEGMFDLAVPFVVDSLSTESGNALCGLQSGDRVFSFNGQSVSFIQDAREVLAGKGRFARTHRRLPADSANRKALLQRPGGSSRRSAPDRRDHKRICPRPWSSGKAVHRSVQVGGQLYRHRTGISFNLGLVPLPEHPRAALHHAGSNEPAANSRTRRRPHTVHPL